MCVCVNVCTCVGVASGATDGCGGNRIIQGEIVTYLQDPRTIRAIWCFANRDLPPARDSKPKVCQFGVGRPSLYPRIFMLSVGLHRYDNFRASL